MDIQGLTLGELTDPADLYDLPSPEEKEWLMEKIRACDKEKGHAQ